jgi:hypothetical protein
MIVTVGLPGSGKTYQATKYAKMHGINYIDADKMFFNGCSLDQVIKKAEKLDPCVVDGLFLTKETQNKFKNASFMYFEPDIENCLYNDKHRRSKNSEITIQQAKVHKPNNIFKVYKVEKYNYLKEIKNTLKISNYCESSEWCTGGTYGTCWDEDGPRELGVDDPEEKYFNEYKIVIDYFMNDPEKYEKYEYFINEGTRSESDYYGGEQYSSYWHFRTDDLIKQILKDLYNVTDVDKIKDTHPELFL